MFECDRIWFLTWTVYGHWLPGDRRGFVSTVREASGGRQPPEPERRRRHNKVGTPYDRDIPDLERAARAAMTERPVRLNASQATALREQFAQTATYRGWRLLAGAVMVDHVHLLVGVSGDPEPHILLRDLKSYGSRALNREGKRRWWTEGGSTRKKADRPAVLAAAKYVRDQHAPLEVWFDAEVEAALAAPGERGASAL